MKDFGKVSSRFWTSDDIQPLSDRAKLMALYLLTTGHGNLIGIFKLSRGYMADDLCWDRSAVQKALAELASNDFLTLSEQSNYLCINRYMEHNPTVNQKQIIARLNALLLLPEKLPEVLPEAVTVVHRVLDKLSSGKVSREVKDKVAEVRRLLESRSETVSPKKIEDRKENIEEEKILVRSADRTPPRTGEVPSSDGSTTGATESAISSASKATKKADDLTDDFEQWWQTFPKREGDKGHKQRTFRKYRKLVREQGFTPAQLLANLQAYAHYCDQTDATGTQYVKTTEPYLNNPDNLTNPWTVNHAARQRAGGQRSALDQVIEANREYLQPEPEFAETTGYDPQDGGSATKRQERDWYNPEADRGAVFDHDGPVRREVDEGARPVGSHGGMAEHPEGFRPETAGSGHQAVSAGEGLAAVSPGVSEAVSAETGGHRTTPDGEGMAGGQRRRRFAQSSPLEPSGGVSGGEGDGLA
ncbi:hypothetical protein [Endozoicomonas atrinae]|uniref:hypothetical protein n=1 Tax=Endozoicomonas atrinae TaxID=1333660 RepID=UPI0008240183|nr:hypothetical protein [Endozoicomonas atrinae]